MCCSTTSSPRPRSKRCQPNWSEADVRPAVTALHCGLGRKYCIEGQANYPLALAPLATHCVTLGKPLPLSEPQCPHLLRAIPQNVEPEQRRVVSSGWLGSESCPPSHSTLRPKQGSSVVTKTKPVSPTNLMFLPPKVPNT